MFLSSTLQNALAILLLVGTSACTVVPAFSSYDNDFVDPDYILAKGFNSSTAAAQNSIVQWANDLASQGPWTVMNKTIEPPTGDKHDYMSWAPYNWPNCTGVGNTTALTPEQIWVTCPYYTIDGDFNPDGRLVNDTGAFSALADAVFYNSMAWVISNSSSVYEQNVANFVQTWFLNNDTKMNPNLNYAQMNRGPDGQVGTHTGVLDLKCMTKLVSGLLILRKGNSTAWTSDLDSQMISWTNEYITWLETNTLALQESAAANNHGTYYYNQLSALKILVNDISGAQNVTRTYFNKQYLSQINATGEQPLEAVRTRPYHYRAYNLAAMITNARIGAYVSFPAWNLTTTQGATIQTALDFTLTVSPGSELASELYPDVAAVAAAYGDPSGKYAAFLATADDEYPAQPYFLWDQPLTDSGLSVTANVTLSGNQTTSASGAAQPTSGGGRRRSGGGVWMSSGLGVAAVMVVVLWSSGIMW